MVTLAIGVGVLLLLRLVARWRGLGRDNKAYLDEIEFRKSVLSDIDFVLVILMMILYQVMF